MKFALLVDLVAVSTQDHGEVDASVALMILKFIIA